MPTPTWRIFLISLRRAEDRRARSLKQLHDLGLPFEIVDAVDAERTKADCLTPDAESRLLRKTVAACYQSHLSVLDHIVAYGLDYGLVLEDDFSLKQSSGLDLANLWEHLPVDADHVQLHALKKFLSQEYAVQEEGKWFNKLTETNVTSVGYIISKRLAAHVLENHASPRTPIDLLYIDICRLGLFNFHDVRESLVEPDWSLPSTIEVPDPEP